MLLEQKMSQFALLGAGWVLWLMVILSVICLALALERALYFTLNRSPTAAFEGALGDFLGAGNRAGLESALKDMRGLEARVIRAGLAAANNGRIDGAEAAMVGTLQFERARLERGVLIVGTVASSVPFVGLFGTVLGIIKAFHDLSLTTGAAAAGDNAGAVMAGISEALVSTAMGLAVAIPAVVLYNLMQSQIKGICTGCESMGQLMLARLQSGPGGAGPGGEA